MGEASNIDEVVVIGAGLSGMTAAYELQRRGVQVRLLEKENDVGLPWRRRHPQLSLNTHRNLSHMPGLRYKAGTPAFPKRNMVADHLQHFVRANKLRVEYGVTVTSLRKSGGVFYVDTDAGEIVAQHVIVAVGRDGLPHIPAIAGQEYFRGQVLHAADFGDARQYSGKRVLVIGAGNSGFDILNQLAKVNTSDCWVSARSGSTILPKRLFGLAVHRFSPIIASLPTRMADIAIKITERAAFGDLTRLGFPRPARGAATRLSQERVAIPVDDGAINAIREGRIKVISEITHFTSAGSATDSEGLPIDVDVIIFATGYSSAIDQVLTDVSVNDEPGVRSGQKNLWFVGMNPGLISYFYNARREALAIARTITSGH